MYSRDYSGKHIRTTRAVGDYFPSGSLLLTKSSPVRYKTGDKSAYRATLAAGAPLFWGALGKFGPKMADGTPFFSDYVSVPGFGLLTADKPYGLLTADNAQMSGAEEWDPLSAP